MSSRRRLSSVSSTPSGSRLGVFFDRYGPESPSASYFLSQVLNAASLTLLARQKSEGLMSGLLLWSLIKSSFSKGLSMLLDMADSHRSERGDGGFIIAIADRLLKMEFRNSLST